MTSNFQSTYSSIVCLLLNAIGVCYSLTADGLGAFYRLAGFVKRNPHDWAVYEKRDDNEHTNDLAKEWLRRAKMSQTKFLPN